MNNYLIHFTTYTFAMIGFLMLAVFIYKKSVYTNLNGRNKDFLKVENSIRLSPGKMIYVIKAGNERFLIAGDSANTTMLSKLGDKNIENVDFKPETNEKIAEFTQIKEFAQRINRG